LYSWPAVPLTRRTKVARATGPSPDPSEAEFLPANTKLLRLGTKRIVVSRPNQRQFGHFGIEMLYALAYARVTRASVVFVRFRSPAVGHALFEVDSDEVRIIRSPTAQLFAQVVWAVRERWWRNTVVATVKREAAAELDRYAKRSRLPKPVRSNLKERARTITKRTAPATQPSPRPGYNRRRLVTTPVRTKLRKDAELRAAAMAASFGIGPDTRLVTVHARERGFKFGYEMQDKAQAAWDDSVRNARIETHFAAIDFLVERGYTVVRIGDRTMTPVARPGVIDLATAPERDALLDLYCLFRSRFVLCGESGPYSVSFLTNTPLLAVNCTDPIGAFPIRPDGIYLLKAVVDRATGRTLTGSALLTRERLESLRDPTKFEFVENTSEQILDAVAEMLDLLDHGTPESPAQTWYRQLVTAAAQACQDYSYVRKHGPDRGYMGYGRLTRSQAEAWAAAEAGLGARPAAGATALR
jgi:putative glycosyltransferase (TIGR04372 family)